MADGNAPKTSVPQQPRSFPACTSRHLTKHGICIPAKENVSLLNISLKKETRISRSAYGSIKANVEDFSTASVKSKSLFSSMINQFTSEYFI